jgi:Peptidase family M41/ATPase family associated with various cellular activities (AAA)
MTKKLTKKSLNLHNIHQRQKDLEAAKKELKTSFIGIDHIIDDLFKYIQIWYLMPELLSRPIIINLWGMTGVGKTDLVRKLVKHLNFQDRFLEVELSNADTTSWMSSVGTVFERNGLNDGKPAIVLFDEIQRFNTLDQDAKPVQNTKFTDFWELLSDGRLSKKEREDLDYYIGDFMFQSKDTIRRKQRGEKDVQDNQTLNFYEAQRFKKMLGLNIELDDMTDMTQHDMVDLIKKERTSKKIYEPVDHSQTLIIVSGNLDEAFEMAQMTAEADIDADIFHAFTKKITLVDIKKALSKRFRPEQVARFGNTHLIYTSLTRADFNILIDKEIARVQQKTLSEFGISVEISTSINQLIYRNGVFPVQGVRPVFSSVVDILETNLTTLLFEAIVHQKESIRLDYDSKKSQIIATVGDVIQYIPFVGSVDKIRENNVQDKVASISVHESGHALVYMLLFGYAPLQLKSRVADNYAGGFTFPHQIFDTKDSILSKIKVFLAGGIAEEVVFGMGYASIGRSNDREQATKLALDYVRKYGFHGDFQADYTLEYAYLMEKNTTDKVVENLITEAVDETKNILIKHKKLLVYLSTALSKSGNLEVSEILQIARDFGLTVGCKEEGYLIIDSFSERIK